MAPFDVVLLQTDRLTHLPEETTVRPALALTAASLVVLSACGAAEPAQSLPDQVSEAPSATAPTTPTARTPSAAPATSEPVPAVTTAPAPTTAPPATAPPPAPTTSAPTTSAPAAATETTYANCTELNAERPHGVGRPGAVDQSSGAKAPVTTFEVNEALYEANRKSDRDGDGIACEKA